MGPQRRRGTATLSFCIQGRLVFLDPEGGSQKATVVVLVVVVVISSPGSKNP